VKGKEGEYDELDDGRQTLKELHFDGWETLVVRFKDEEGESSRFSMCYTSLYDTYSFRLSFPYCVFTPYSY
jgi:hypothetical protein